MQLRPGVRLGPYEIVAALGAGGMGEVYRARDPRLQRDVAIKILPPALASDPVAHARFEREAQAVAALSHPNILAIHDLGRDGEHAYAVMELLEGRTLREVLSTGPLPVRKAVELALQMAHGLAAAHARGIVHRDLKPENLFISSDGRLKILDFGLAHATAGSIPPSTATAAATVMDTTPGTIVGTVGYMAPEQIRGLDVDPRADIFSFGVVLYEMLAGERAFEGDTRADLLSAVLRSDPPELTTKRSEVPAALDRMIRRCLEKSAEERFQSARDLGYALEAVSTSGTSARLSAPDETGWRRGRYWLPIAAAVFAAAALGVLAGRSARPAPAAADLTPVRFTIPSDLGQPPWVSVAPDGKTIAWSQADPVDNSMVIWVRRLEDAQARPLAWSGRGYANGVTEWTPDGRSMAIIGQDVVLFDVTTGAQRVLYKTTEEDRKLPPRGMAISGNAVIVGARNVLVRFPLEGGAPAPLTTLDTARHLWHGGPRALPDGRIVFSARLADESGSDTLVASPQGEIVGRLELPPSVQRVAVDPAGAVLYAQTGSLVAQRVNWSTLAVEGPPVTVAADLLSDQRSTGTMSASVSAAGVLAYRTSGLSRVQFEWVDRTGRPLGNVGPPDTFTNFDLSPDGNTIAVTRREQTQNWLWTIDVTRAIAAPTDATQRMPPSDPTWSPDGKQLAFRRGNTLVTRPAFGGTERVLAEWSGYPDSWTRDGKYLAVGRANAGNYELWVVRADGAATEQIPVVTGLLLADEARFSPDGRWLAFHAALERGGTTQVFAVPFPPTGERWQLSNAGGMQPRWRADGRELFYLSPDGRLMGIDIPSGDPRRAATPAPLFRLSFEPSPANDQFTVASDGRFLIRRPLSGSGTDEMPVVVLVNWRKIVGLE